MRKQVLPGFTRGALESWQPMIDRMAAELVETVTAASTCDVVPTLAAPMPMAIISHILGISEDDQSAFRDWSNETIRIADGTSPGPACAKWCRLSVGSVTSMTSSPID